MTGHRGPKQPLIFGGRPCDDGRMASLNRPSRGRIIAGGIAGIAQRFGVSPFRVRVAFVLSLLLPGPQILIDRAIWIIVPKGP